MNHEDRKEIMDTCIVMNVGGSVWQTSLRSLRPSRLIFGRIENGRTDSTMDVENTGIS